MIATTIIATMAIRTRLLATGGRAGGIVGSAKLAPPSGRTQPAPGLYFGKNGRTLFNGFSWLRKVVEPRTNQSPFGQSLNQRLDSGRVEVAFVAQKFPEALRVEGAGDDLVARCDRRMQEEFVDRVDVVRKGLADILGQ